MSAPDVVAVSAMNAQSRVLSSSPFLRAGICLGVQPAHRPARDLREWLFGHLSLRCRSHAGGLLNNTDQRRERVTKCLLSFDAALAEFGGCCMDPGWA